MRVLLVVPTYMYKWRYPAPMSTISFSVGMAYLASSLKVAGHEVYGLNPNNMYQYASAHEMLKDQLTKSIGNFQPGLIGLGGLCADYSFLKDATAIIRALVPRTPIVLGGRVVTHDTEFIVKYFNPDYHIEGDGEYALVELVNKLSGNNKLAPFDHNIDSLPFPDYSSFDIEGMLSNSGYFQGSFFFTREHPRVMPIITARGCPYSCSFCLHRHDRRYRPRAIPSIKNEITETYEKYHYNIMFILDELFAVNKDRVIEFSEMVLEGRQKLGWDFDWTFQTHASARFDVETLKLAKRAGCFSFSYGVESLSPTVLASMNKKTKPEQIFDSIRKSEEAGLGFVGSIICGDRAESIKTLAQTLSGFGKHCRSSFFAFGTVHPYPGSALFDYCLGKGIIKNREHFYEHMDEQLYNMTEMPYWLWRPYFLMLGVLGSKHLWHKTAKMNKDGSVTCPHCRAKAVIVCVPPIEVKQIKTHGRLYQIMLLISAVPVLFHPIIFSLRVLLGKPGQYYVGGCKTCGKSFKLAVKELVK